MKNLTEKNYEYDIFSDITNLKIILLLIPIRRQLFVNVTIVFAVYILVSMASSDETQRKSSISHRYSEFSVEDSDKNIWIQVTSDKLSNRIKDYLRLIFITLPPICVVMTLCAISLQAGQRSIEHQNSLQNELTESQIVGQLVNGLAQERGFTCFYLSSASDSQKDLSVSKLLQIRANTDRMANLITRFGTNEENFRSKEEFKIMLDNVRSLVDSKKITICDQVTTWYSDKIQKLTEQMSRTFMQSIEGEFWASVDSYRHILVVKDLLGLQRVLGTSFFTNGYFPNQDYAKFSRYSGASEKILNVSLYKSPTGSYKFNELKTKYFDLVSRLETFYEIIFKNERVIPNLNRSLDFFELMSSYLEIFEAIQLAITENLNDDMTKNVNSLYDSFNINLAVIIVVLVLSPSSTLWYALRSRNLMNKLRHFAEQVNRRNKDLAIEKEKTDFLLYQILPKSVALEIKRNNLIAPENFESATIFFSDIQGFTTLSSKCKPLEIVDLLNQLYTKFDEVLDQYDVYKVETIGDAYVVVSGVPQRNGTQHSAEICTMALHLLQNIAAVPVPYHEHEQLLMRIGVHTGSCAAGVVGTKMPRYCLFGSAVNIANTMESKGTALCIHLSCSTAEHLQQNHPNEFLTVSNGMLHIKQVGEMETFWLLEKRNFAYKVNLQQSNDIIAKTNYWCNQI